MWRPLIAELAKTNTVIAPDLRGFGQPVKPPQGYDKKTMAQDIHALATSLGYKRVRIAGHDIGLMVAYAYAAQFRAEVDRVVLMDAFLPRRRRLDQGSGCCATSGISISTARPRSSSSPARAHLFRAFLERLRRRPEENRCRKATGEIYADAYAQPGGCAPASRCSRHLNRTARISRNLPKPS